MVDNLPLQSSLIASRSQYYTCFFSFVESFFSTKEVRSSLFASSSFFFSTSQENRSFWAGIGPQLVSRLNSSYIGAP